MLMPACYAYSKLLLRVPSTVRCQLNVQALSELRGARAFVRSNYEKARIKQSTLCTSLPVEP